MMNFTTLSKIVETPEGVIDFCRSSNLIVKEKSCKKCHFICILMTRKNVKDKYSWRCTNKKCRIWSSLKTGTIFSQSNLEIGQILKLIYLWSNGFATELTVRHECGISSPSTITDWKNFLRQVCREHFKKNRYQIGGPGHTVELGEVLFNRCKYNNNNNKKGKLGVTPLWVLGGYDVTAEQGFLVPVANRNAETLLPIIKKYVLPGTSVVCEYYKTFNKMGEGYKHLPVRNRLDFVDPLAMTSSYVGGGKVKNNNRVEMMWKEATSKNKKECAASRPLLDSYLTEFMWRQQFRADPFMSMLEQIAQSYTSQQQPASAST